MRGPIACLALALALPACGQADSGAASDQMAVEGNAVATLAFEYNYSFRLPARQVGALQDRHADACERLGAERCTITGLNLTVDEGGNVDALLSVAVERSLARRFGRAAVVGVEEAGGALIGSRIEGTDTAAAIAAGSRDAAFADRERARIDAALAAQGTNAQERAELQRQRAALGDRRQAGRDEADVQRARAAVTPITFRYESGRGVGAGARLRDAVDLAATSATTTLAFLLQALALLGPPVLLIAVLWWLFWRFVAPAWRRAMHRPAAGSPPATDA